jgi:hypothetical protein
MESKDLIEQHSIYYHARQACREASILCHFKPDTKANALLYLPLLQILRSAGPNFMKMERKH